MGVNSGQGTFSEQEAENPSWRTSEEPGCGREELRGVSGGSSQVELTGFELNFRKLRALGTGTEDQGSHIPSCLWPGFHVRFLSESHSSKSHRDKCPR